MIFISRNPSSICILLAYSFTIEFAVSTGNEVASNQGSSARFLDFLCASEAGFFIFSQRFLFLFRANLLSQHEICRQ